MPPSLPRISQSQRAVSHPKARVRCLCSACPAAMGGDSTSPALQRGGSEGSASAARCIEAHPQLCNWVPVFSWIRERRSLFSRYGAGSEWSC